MIGKILKGRYRVVQSLSAGAFGQTYIAEDTLSPDNPKCVVKHLKTLGADANCLEITWRRFITEVEALKQLGDHERIPQLIDCFHKADEFCLVQELIEGHPLSAELPLQRSALTPPSQRLPLETRPYEKRWTESQVIQLLQEVLEILEFVHSRGIIHCDLKPDNILRRECDSKIFLIDFGAVQPVRPEVNPLWVPTQEQLKTKLGASPLGYLPAEQLTGHPHPTSDLYALGLIAIQALTGWEPGQLEINPDTGEVVWQHLCKGTAGVPGVSFQLAFVLNQMVRYDLQERYQSATETLQALQQLSMSRQLSAMPVQLSTASSQEKPPHTPNPRRDTSFFFPQRLPLLTGLGVGLVANVLVITFGLYSLLHASTSQSETDILRAAQEEYQAGDLEKAIQLAKSIPKNSPIYPEAQAAMREWRQEWKTAADQFNAAEQALNEGRWIDALEEARKIPEISHWQEKAEPLVRQAQPQIESQAQQLLQKAYSSAAEKDFTSALESLRQIPPNSPLGPQAAKKLQEYRGKQNVQANYLLQLAYERAAQKDFAGAMNYLQQIAQDTPAWSVAEKKLEEYTQKQHIQAEVLLQKANNYAAGQDFTTAIDYLQQIPQDSPVYDQAQSLIEKYLEMQRLQVEIQQPTPSPSPQLNDIPQASETAKGFLDLNPGNHWQEIFC